MAGPAVPPFRAQRATNRRLMAARARFERQSRLKQGSRILFQGPPSLIHHERRPGTFAALAEELVVGPDVISGRRTQLM
jgi:hypothetical protein